MIWSMVCMLGSLFVRSLETAMTWSTTILLRCSKKLSSWLTHCIWRLKRKPSCWASLGISWSRAITQLEKIRFWFVLSWQAISGKTQIIFLLERKDLKILIYTCLKWRIFMQNLWETIDSFKKFKFHQNSAILSSILNFLLQQVKVKTQQQSL